MKLTGSETLDVGALAECFEPLRKWMVEQREEIGYAAPGWGDDDDDIITDGVTSLDPVLLNTFACALGCVPLGVSDLRSFRANPFSDQRSIESTLDKNLSDH